MSKYWKFQKQEYKIPLAPMGSWLPGLRTLDLPLSPPATPAVKILGKNLINFNISDDAKHFFPGKKTKKLPL
jgi:hypothetical protein